jgi:CHASE2 domain-containing sensor protein
MNTIIRFVVRITFPLVSALVLLILVQPSMRLDSILFYNQVDQSSPDDRQKWGIDFDIVLVDTSSIYDSDLDITSRAGLARLLEDVRGLQPAVTGLDIFFEFESDDDTELLDYFEKHGDELVILNRHDLAGGGLQQMAEPFRRFGSGCYGTVRNNGNVIPSPEFITGSSKSEIIPFSLELFRRYAEKRGAERESIRTFIRELTGNGNDDIYLSYFYSRDFPVLQCDSSGNLITESFIPKVIYKSHFTDLYNNSLLSDQDRSVLRESYILDESAFYLVSGLKQSRQDQLSRILIDSGLYRDTVIILGDWYSPFNDKKITPRGILPGVYIHAHALSAAISEFDPTPGRLERFAITMKGFGAWLFLVLFIFLYISIIDFFYMTFAFGNYRRSYLVQSIIMITSMLLLVVSAIVLYWMTALRLPITLLGSIIIMGYNLFLFYEYRISLLMAVIYADTRYSYLPEFNRRSFIRYYIEADLYNKLNILINTFEQLLQYLSFIAVADILDTFSGIDEIPKKSRGLLKDMKQKLRRPTTGVFRSILMDTYPTLLGDNRFFKVDEQLFEPLNESMNDFISLRNSFFHKSGSFYTDKTKRLKVREYSLKIEQFYSLLRGIADYSMETTEHGEVFLAGPGGDRLLLSPLVISRPSTTGGRGESLFLYNGNLFDGSLPEIEYVCNITDHDPMLPVSVPEKVLKTVFKRVFIRRVKDKASARLILDSYAKKGSIYTLRRDLDDVSREKTGKILEESGLISTRLAGHLALTQRFFSELS